MSKTSEKKGNIISYFDWSLQFRKGPKEEPHKLNSTGISQEEFKDFVDAWRKKNLDF